MLTGGNAQVIKQIINALKAHMNLSISVSFFLLGIIIFGLSYSQILGVSDWSLSPGFFPRLSAGLVIFLSLLLFVVTFRFGEDKPPSDSGKDSRRGVKFALITIGLIAVYPYLIDYIGFLASSFIIMSAMMVLYGLRRWFLIGTLCLCIPVAVYYLAFKVMFILFPMGKIFEQTS